jgi:antitoxin component HigA of HigAB toxin-antitoxin module
MKISKEKLDSFQTLEDLEKEIFTEKEIKDLNKRALQRAAMRRQLSEAISKSVAQYMAYNNLGFNDLKRQLGMSSATVSRIVKGDANLTLDTLSDLMNLTGMRVDINYDAKGKRTGYTR